jgi:hypothetical protein
VAFRDQFEDLLFPLGDRPCWWVFALGDPAGPERAGGLDALDVRATIPEVDRCVGGVLAAESVTVSPMGRF